MTRSFQSIRHTRVLRTSMYAVPSDEPMTIVVRDRDIVMPLEEMTDDRVTPGAFVYRDIFTMQSPEVTIEQATAEAMSRMAENRERERNMAILFYYNAMTFAKVTDGGKLYQTQASPLSVEEVKIVFRQLVDHPRYRSFRMMAICEGGEIVEMHDGHFTVR